MFWYKIGFWRGFGILVELFGFLNLWVFVGLTWFTSGSSGFLSFCVFWLVFCCFVVWFGLMVFLGV